MTDRFFQNGAFKTLQYHQSKKSDTYFYFFKAETLNILPIDPHWQIQTERKYDFVPYKSLGIAHGDDVRKILVFHLHLNKVYFPFRYS